MTGDVIPGAIVASPTDKERLGVTAGRGELILKGERLGTGHLAVMAEGFVSRELRLERPFPRVIEVVLRRGAEIVGRVVDPERVPLGEGVTVLAVGPRYYFSDRALELAALGSPLVSMTETDASGRFVLNGLDPDLSYRVFAAGLGHASFEERTWIAPGPDAHVEITALPVYGAMIALRDGHGAELALGDFWGSWSGSVSPMESASWLRTTKWTRRFLLDPHCNEEPGAYDQYQFFTAGGASDGAVSLRFRCQLPGYLPVDVTVDALPAIECVPRYEIPVTQVCEGFGEIGVFVRTQRQGDPVPALSSANGACELELTETTSRTRITTALDSLAREGVHVVEGVPYGEYSAVFKAPHQLYRFPKNPGVPFVVRVGPEPVAMEVVLPPLTTVELKILDERGYEYGGPISGSHELVEGGELDAFYFHGAPYEIPLLPDGEYRFVVNNNIRGGVELPPRTVRLDGSEGRVVLTWQLPR